MKHIKYSLLTLFITTCIHLVVYGQPVCHFEHYSLDNGLPQNTVMNILQDKKGFIWVSTWNGISKFDGYRFTNYRTNPGDPYYIKNNRIDKIYEDKYGYIWLYSYDKNAHRFDPRTETFSGLKSFDKFKDFTFLASKIMVMPSGNVWLLSDEYGCICVTDSLFSTEVYNVGNGRIQGKKVFTVTEDDEANTWILTDNGLYRIPCGQTEPEMFFTEKVNAGSLNMQEFFSVSETGDEIWFGSNNGRIWKYGKQSKEFNLMKTKTESSIIEIRKLPADKILFTTPDNGFFIFDKASGEIFSYNTTTLPNLKSDHIISSYIDKMGNIWLHLNCPGVAKFDPFTQTLKHFNVKTEQINTKVFLPNFFIFEDKNDRLWVHPNGGGFSLYDRGKDELLPFYNEPFSPLWRFSNLMHSAYSDRQGNLWLSTRSNGLEKVMFEDGYFRTEYINPMIHSTIANDVRAVFEDSDKNLWVSTKDGKITMYDSLGNSLGYLCENGQVGNGNPLKGIAYCIMQDTEGVVWIGTRGEGIYTAKKIASSGKLKYQITNYKNSISDIFSLSDNNIYSIFRDRRGHIWAGTYGGGLNLIENDDQGNLRFINHRNHLKNYPMESGYQVRIVAEDKYGNICVGTTIGLIMFSSDFQSPQNINFKVFTSISGNKENLKANDIYCICTTKKGETYIATFGGGLNKIAETDPYGFPLHFDSYTVKNGLPSDVTLSVIEDEEGKLWITTENNLTRFNPENNTFETFGNIKRLINGQTFSEASNCRLHSNKIIFGYSRGLLSFFPKEIEKNTFVPYIGLVQFRLFNKEVSVGKDSPLKNNIDDMKSLRLNHKQNFFSIEYAALDFVNPQNVLYAYKLDGFDEDWIYVQKQRIANYMNLSKGNYVFRVKSTNSDGIWVDNERRIAIEILPSFWETPLAYMIYFLLFVLLTGTCVYILFIFYRLKDKVKLEQAEAEMKLRFFTDISHEIRTPLTMIVSPIEYIAQDEDTPSWIKEQLIVVSQNTNRLLRMVNQILDFRKIQHQKLTIREVEIAPFLREICNDFKETIIEKKISFHFNDYAQGEKIWIDKDAVEKMVYNLLSNAFKYTSDGKQIEVNVVKENDTVSIQVKDEGVGILKDKIKLLFNRFASFNEDKSKPSTGIGLSIVKDLADKHHAKVLVDSELNKGSCFTLVFKTGLSHFSKDTNVIIEKGEVNQLPTVTEENIDIIEESESEKDKNTENIKPSILVVEDDEDLRHFLKSILSSDYEVLLAVDGQDGLEKALKEIPDFVVSDIMMPRMDGLQLLKELKTNVNTSHIPFILLTAKTNIESKLEGLTYGADDYITKPFNVQYFRTRIDNLIEQRKRLQQFYCSSHFQTAPINSKLPQITSQDTIFMNKIMDKIEQNMDNDELTVDELVSTVAMSRTVFFKKIKSLTGLAPIEFIKDIRIQRAAQLISTMQGSIKEIAFMIGMSDPKYFSKCFKKKYGVSPIEYKNRYGKKQM